ncbi:hypothetical protein McpSp1_02480 [Methanocorpusculaceae archaeon Sp1]|nr:hypothetical protein [Methanocorpusculaceae archaeon Sp1]
MGKTLFGIDEPPTEKRKTRSCTEKHHGADENTTEINFSEFRDVLVCSVMFFSVKFPCTPFFRGRQDLRGNTEKYNRGNACDAEYFDVISSCMRKRRSVRTS